MKTRTALGSILVAAVACLGLSTPAFATVQTIDLGKVLVGYSPSGTGPWLEAQFTFTSGDTSGTLLLTSMLTGSEKVQGAGVTGWGFNVNDSVTGYTWSGSGTQASTVLTSSFNTPNNGIGSYNLGFDWKTPALMSGDKVSYTLNFANPLGSTSPFVINNNGYISYAHIQSIGSSGCSGFIVNGSAPVGAPNGELCSGTTPPPTSVPEPGALGMFGLGVLLIGGFVTWRRRNYA